MRIAFTLALVALTIGSCGIPSADDVPSVAVLHGRVWTGNPDQPWAQAVAVSGRRIIAVGSDDEIRGLINVNTTVLSAEGGTVCPGFIDAHVHLLDAGARLAAVQLRNAVTPAAFTNRISAFAARAKPGEWITGGDWDHEHWGGELPRRDWIDAATPDNPVFIQRLDGHMGLANSLALQRAGVSDDIADVAGGEIVRDENGSLTGLLKDNAMSLVTSAIPEPTMEAKRRALDAAMNYVATKGVTSVHDMGGGRYADIDALQLAHREGRLITRIYAVTPLHQWRALQQRIADRGRGDEWLRFGGLKGFVDGSLGSHTAAFYRGYRDAPNDTGLFVNDPDDLYRWIRDADRAGLQVMVHAIGDRAISFLLDTYERVAHDNGEHDRRFRVEHAQHIAATDIPRFGQLGVIASMQPYHAIDDGRWAERLIGADRASTTYAFRSLLDTGATLAFGSDWFVAPPTPIEGIYAAVTRRTLDGAHPDGWVPAQKITVDQALRAYTIDAARASFEEELKGTLEVGKLADLVILSRDLSSIPAVEIRDVKVQATIVGGKVVFER